MILSKGRQHSLIFCDLQVKTMEHLTHLVSRNSLRNTKYHREGSKRAYIALESR